MPAFRFTPPTAHRPLVQILYCSVLASREDLCRLSALARAARVYTKEHGISGMLMFDGHHLCEYLEGDWAPMQQLVTRIEGDARHTQFTPLLHGPLTGPRLFKSWSMAYAEVDDVEHIPEIAQLTGTAALHAFLRLSQHVECL